MDVRVSASKAHLIRSGALVCAVGISFLFCPGLRVYCAMCIAPHVLISDRGQSDRKIKVMHANYGKHCSCHIFASLSHVYLLAGRVLLLFTRKLCVVPPNRSSKRGRARRTQAPAHKSSKVHLMNDLSRLTEQLISIIFNENSPSGLSHFP